MPLCIDNWIPESYRGSSLFDALADGFLFTVHALTLVHSSAILENFGVWYKDSAIIQGKHSF